VVITAYDGDEYQQRAKALGVCGYIIKPVTALTLLPKLETAFQQYKQRPQ
jgi:AmiR/NasT family two-component response regulator